jgi:cytochrome P450
MTAAMATRSFADLQAPRGLPLLGNALQLKPGVMHLQLEAWQRQFGPIFGIRLGRRRVVIVADPAQITQILRDRPEGFRRTATVEPVFEELGINGLFSAEGERWRRMRRIWMASLNAQQLKGFHDELEQIALRLLRRWQRAADAGDAVDVAADLMRFTVDVTLRFAFDHDANTLEQGEDVIQRHLNRVFPAFGRRLFTPFPYWRWFKLPVDRALDRSLAEIRREVARLIAEAHQRLQDDPQRRSAPACFLEAVLAAREAEGSPFTDDDVFANCITALLGGEDTTANTLAWMMHYTSLHPEVLQALRAEADALIGPYEADAAAVLNPEHFPPLMRAVDAVMNETLRLRPITPMFAMTAVGATTVGDVAVPAGGDVWLLVRAAAGSAPGAEPEPRFEPKLQEAPSTENGPGRVATLPFGHGPRMCPGRNLATAEIRIAMLMVARNFDLEPVPGARPVAESFEFTLVPRNLRLRFRRRAN